MVVSPSGNKNLNIHLESSLLNSKPVICPLYQTLSPYSTWQGLNNIDKSGGEGQNAILLASSMSFSSLDLTDLAHFPL